MDNDNLVEWPDGSYCYGHELPAMSHKSDDYVIHLFESPEWWALVEKEEL